MLRNSLNLFLNNNLLLKRFFRIRVRPHAPNYYLNLLEVFKNVPDLLDYILEGYEENWQYVVYDNCDFYCLKMLDCLERTNFITSYMRIYSNVKDEELVDNSFNLQKALKYQKLDKDDFYSNKNDDGSDVHPYFEVMRHTPIISVMIFLKYITNTNMITYGAIYGFLITWDNPKLPAWSRESLQLGFHCDDGLIYRRTACIFLTPTRIKFWCSTYIFLTEEEILANNSLHGRLYCLVW